MGHVTPGTSGVYLQGATSPLEAPGVPSAEVPSSETLTDRNVEESFQMEAVRKTCLGELCMLL